MIGLALIAPLVICILCSLISAMIDFPEVLAAVLILIMFSIGAAILDGEI